MRYYNKGNVFKNNIELSDMHDTPQNDLEESQEHYDNNDETESEQTLVETMKTQLEQENDKVSSYEKKSNTCLQILKISRKDQKLIFRIE